MTMQSTQIEKALKLHLETHLPHHHVREIYYYAVLPGGKLFRPQLIWSILEDLNSTLYHSSKENNHSNHALWASAVEFHHSYTLLHDDLPCMDNDLVRRGKDCTHIAFGEWQALLVGDGLLNISYQLLGKIKHRRGLDLLSFFSWATGPKGLIHGQVLDLAEEMTHSFKNTLRTHELKTARLIQVAILGSALLLEENSRQKHREKLLWKYSRLLGINFQFIDDLSELTAEQLSPHESAVNPWHNFPNESCQQLIDGLKQFSHLSQELKLVKTSSIVSDYYIKMLSVIEKSEDVIAGHLKIKLDLSPIILLMKSFSDI